MKNRLYIMYQDDGAYVARWYVSDHGYWDKVRFIGYSKKEVINKLRHEYNLVVPKEAIL